MADGPADRIGQRVKHITADLKKYVEKRLELMVISIGEQYARMVAKSVQKATGFLFLFGALVFLLIALALYLGALLNSRSLGFVLVSIPLLIVGYLFINLKPKSVGLKLQSEFEEELLSMLNAKSKDDHRRLINRDSQESLKKKEYDE